MGVLRNVTKNSLIAADVNLAEGEAARLRGFLGRVEIGADEGLWFSHARMIHTAGMKTRIDIVFLDTGFRVIHLAEDAGAWRVFGAWNAAHAVELAPGTIRKAGLSLGDVLALEGTNVRSGAALRE